MIKVSVEGADSLTDGVNEAIRRGVGKHVSEQLADFTCPQHGTPIEAITIKAERNRDLLNEVTVTISGCCAVATEAASELIGEAGAS